MFRIATHYIYLISPHIYTYPADRETSPLHVRMNIEKATYCATVGVFDGVHRGHQQVIRCVKAQAAASGMQSMVVTFDRNPLEVICPERAPKPLMSLSERVAKLHAAGIDRVEVLPFDNAFMQTTAYDFMRYVLYERLGVRCLITGYDNRFGRRNPEETFETYAVYGREIGMEVMLGPQPEECGLYDGRPVSSSLIRHLLDTGRRDEADALMMLE